VEVVFKSNYIWQLLNLVNVAVFLPVLDKSSVAYNVPIWSCRFGKRYIYVLFALYKKCIL